MNPSQVDGSGNDCDVERALWTAAAAVAGADCILIAAGAGMSADSGLPVYRGSESFWNQYPALRQLGKGYADMARHEWFETDPSQAWGFFGDQMRLLGDVKPHEGYHILRRWMDTKDVFVFTSNVDGAFIKAGFPPERVTECHGSFARMQCTRESCVIRNQTFMTPADLAVDVDLDTVRAMEASLPRCPHCGAVARPHVVMFDDEVVAYDAIHDAMERCEDWVSQAASKRLVVLEIGAGAAVPTVRERGVSAARRCPQSALVRVNPLDATFAPGEDSSAGTTVGLALGALDAVKRIDSAVSSCEGQPSTTARP